MSVLLFVLLTILVAILLVFIILAKAVFTFDTDNARATLTVLWLSPIFKAVVAYENAPPVLTGYLFNKIVYTKVLKAGRHGVNIGEASRMKLYRNVRLIDMDVHASYGFSDPATTGLACGVFGVISQLLDIDSLHQSPNFISDSEYVDVYATAKVNIGLTLYNLIRAYINSSVKQLSYQNG